MQTQSSGSTFMVYGVDAASRLQDWRRQTHPNPQQPEAASGKPGLAGYRHNLNWQNRVRPVVRAKEAMFAPVVTVQVDATLLDAWNILQREGFGHLPVVSQMGRPVGMISAHGLQGLLVQGHGWDAPLWRESVAHHMSTPLLACGPDADVHDIARVLLDRKIGSLAIVESDSGHDAEDASPRLVGIITRTDLLRCLIEHPSLQLLG